MTLRVSVVVAAFNEVANLEPVVRELHAALLALPAPPGPDASFAHELLIIDDGSSDGTGALADRLAAELPGIRVIHFGVNRGLGAVYRTGFAEARRDLLIFYPADGQFESSILHDFYPRMADHDLVLGYLPRRDKSTLAKILSGLERFLYRILFGYMPRFQGLMMLRRAVLADLDLDLQSRDRSWVVVMEMILQVHRRGYRVISVPTTVKPRLSGESKVNNLRNIWINLVQTAALRRTFRR